VQDDQGNILENANVSVYLAGTTTPAVVYLNKNDVTGVRTPPQLLSGIDGVVVFWLDSADYSFGQLFDIQVTKDTFRAQMSDVQIIVWDAVSASNADKVDGFHASRAPGPNTIPVSFSDKKLSEGWTKFGFDAYSGLSVGTSFPESPRHNDLFWNSDELRLYKYDLRTQTWTEIDWRTIVKASPEWHAGRLRVNSSTRKLEISPDGTNWYECIPAVGSNVIRLMTIDNSDYSYKYWIAPGTAVMIWNANHIPIVCAKDVFPNFLVSFRFNSEQNALVITFSNISSTGKRTHIHVDSDGNGPYKWTGDASYLCFGQWSYVFAGWINVTPHVVSCTNLAKKVDDPRFYCHGSCIATPSTGYWLGVCDRPYVCLYLKRI